MLVDRSGGPSFVLHGLSWFSGALKLLPWIKPEGGDLFYSPKGTLAM